MANAVLKSKPLMASAYFVLALFRELWASVILIFAAASFALSAVTSLPFAAALSRRELILSETLFSLSIADSIFLTIWLKNCSILAPLSAPSFFLISSILSFALSSNSWRFCFTSSINFLRISWTLFFNSWRFSFISWRMPFIFSSIFHDEVAMPFVSAKTKTGNAANKIDAPVIKKYLVYF